MFKKLSKKIKSPTKEVGGKPGVTEPVRGAAVPYRDPDEETKANGSEVARAAAQATNGTGDATVQAQARLSTTDESMKKLITAVQTGNITQAESLLKAGTVDVHYTDKNGDGLLHMAAQRGLTGMVKCLLLYGANIEMLNRTGQNALYVAVDHGKTGTVGILLDYMHSVDSKMRGPFVLIRGNRIDGSHVTDFVASCNDVSPLSKRGLHVAQILITYGQKAQDLAVFLYSVLDTVVSHAFFVNTVGDMNMKNFQRFENKGHSESIIVLNTKIAATLEACGYTYLRTLILVSCNMTKLVVDGLTSLELLDIRHNILQSLPENIGSCSSLRTLRCAHNQLRRLPRSLSQMSSKLMFIEASHNHMQRLTSSIVGCHALKYLHVNHNFLMELPVDVGLLAQLEELYVNNNKISQLPPSISSLHNLKKLTFNHNPLLNIPVDFPEKASEVREYLHSLQEDPVLNKAVKLVLVGQEGVGKTTLLKSLKRTLWVLPKAPEVKKTEGIDVREMQLGDIMLRCFDCGGDIDFNETHNFFITQGALYLACFNLSEYCFSTVERSSFLLGRLQLWLQYIFTKVPNSQVVIVGTHADHPALKKEVFEEIWEQIRAMLVKAREHHRQFFQSHDRLNDCFLCQADSKCLRRATHSGKAGYVNISDASATKNVEEETSFSDGPLKVISFPHIVGYYEISSVKSVGNKSLLNFSTNQSIEQLKDAISELATRIIQGNPEIPRRWANVRTSIQNRVEMQPEDCVASLNEIQHISKVHGVTKPNELHHMLQFLKAQGYVLYFPQMEELRNFVILDPEWLAKVFSSVITFRETGISEEGFMDRERLKATWPDVDKKLQARLIQILRYFGICIPIDESNLELFPSRLPLGEPDEDIWPATPGPGERQLTYSVTFPSIIPPPFFSDLIVTAFKFRAGTVFRQDAIRYLANHLVDDFRLEKPGCRDCIANNNTEGPMMHKVHFELIPHRRIIQVTVRGEQPCCMMKRMNRLLNKVVSSYEGLGKVEFDTILCPGCVLQNVVEPHRYSAKILLSDQDDGTVRHCNNSHVIPSRDMLIMGMVHESCLPMATMRPKHYKQSSDFSGCPKLLMVLPVNRDGLSFDPDNKLFASSMLLDGYAAHLMCEFPDGYHFTRAPGYRLKKPDEFMVQFGAQVYDVLKLLRCLTESSVVSPQHAERNRSVVSTIDQVMADLQRKFQRVKIDTKTELAPQKLASQILKRGEGFKREDLRKYLHLVDRPDSFGPLRRIAYSKQTLWLCRDHYKQLKIITIDGSASNSDSKV